MLKKNDCYEVIITGMSSEGNGVTRIDNMAVFIPNTAVGDNIRIKIVKVLASYAFGIIDEIIMPSPTRILVDCECYNQCGGCTFRHISYEAELDIKQDYVAQAFTRIGEISIPCSEIIGSTRVDRYRNKAQYPVAITDEEISCGFFAKRSHRVIDSNDCMLQSLEFQEIRTEIIEFIKEHKISVYDEITEQGEIRHIYLRKAEQTNEIMVCIVVKKKLLKQELLVKALTSKFPNITGIITNYNNKSTNVIVGERCETIYGKEYITDILCGVKVMISPLAFYQVNKEQAEILYTKALELANLNKNDILIDLYCGTGTIGLIAASQVNKVIGIEIISDAIKNAKANARLNDITNIEFICDDAAGATQELLRRNTMPTVVLVDPPRKGLDTSVIEDIITMSPERIVMVSCNPATAARDCKLLEQNGYIVKQIIPVDMFPRTTHVECVVKLCRVDNG